MTNTRGFAVGHGKPFMAAEFGVQEDPQVAGRKGAWYQELATTAKEWPELIALVYFDSDKIYGGCPTHPRRHSPATGNSAPTPT